MTHKDKDTELYDKAEELIEQKPEFAEGETYGQVTISDMENIEEDQQQDDPDETPIFTDTEPLDEAVPNDPDHDHPQEHIGLMPLIRPDHPL